MHVAALDAVDEPRKPPREPRRVEPSTRSPLAETEVPRAEVEHGRVRGLEVEPPILDLHQMKDHPRQQTALVRAKALQTREERRIRELRQNTSHDVEDGSGRASNDSSE